MLKIGWVALGCPKNQVDTEFMIGLMKESGYEQTARPEEADILAINTCCFIQPATEESLDRIVEYARYKKENCRLLVVLGCLPQRYGRQLLDLLPEVDLWLGTGGYSRLPELIGAALARDRENGKRPGLFTVEKPGWLPEPGLARVLSTAPYTAYVKIAEGCENHCRYCVIPRIRGPYRSRPPEEIEQEVRELVDSGVKEINLVAQDTTAYGVDREGCSALPQLLSRLDRIEGDFWLRVLYAYPDRVSDELLAVFYGSEHLCAYLDLPLQHISGKILKAMGRHSTPEGILRLLERIRQLVPGMALRTTFILGYPGETEEDFDGLLSFLDVARFDWVGAFPYFPEEGTPAAVLKPQIPPAVRERRRQELLAKQEAITAEKNRALCGKHLKVLVEKNTADGWVGRSYREAPEIDGLVRLAPVNLPARTRVARTRAINPGDFLTVEVTGAETYEVYARLPAVMPP
ncbi:MAG TPA: 30S ribosomal protein S12 methylthiotransferase RimO [Firmicutes bacterium]|nr:30S ribosomal protein S12 methylthiotransferase RimO [Bacillota bacterium]